MHVTSIPLSRLQAWIEANCLDSNFSSSTHLLDDLEQVIAPPGPVSSSANGGAHSIDLRELVCELNVLIQVM